MWTVLGWNSCSAVCFGASTKSGIGGIDRDTIYHAKTAVEISEPDVSYHAKVCISEYGISEESIYFVMQFDDASGFQPEVRENSLSGVGCLRREG